MVNTVNFHGSAAPATCLPADLVPTFHYLPLPLRFSYPAQPRSFYQGFVDLLSRSSHIKWTNGAARRTPLFFLINARLARFISIVLPDRREYSLGWGCEWIRWSAWLRNVGQGHFFYCGFVWDMRRAGLWLLCRRDVCFTSICSGRAKSGGCDTGWKCWNGGKIWERWY